MTAACMTATVATVSGISATTGISTVSGKTAVNVTTIHITTVYIPTGIAGVAKSSAEACTIKPSAVKISGIGPFKEGPIVGIVIIIPVVAIPGGIVIIRIAREFIIEVSAHYHTWGRGIFILVNGCRFCIDLGLAAGSDQTGSYYCGECKERFHDSRVFKLGDNVLLYKKAVELITYMTSC